MDALENDYMPSLLRSLMTPFRHLTARPALSLTAIMTLALGIGASTAIYSVADGVLLRPLPFARPHELVSLSQVNRGGQPARFSRLNYEDLADAAGSYRAVARYSAGLMPVVGATEPVRVSGAWVSAQFFEVLGVTPSRGRLFSDAERTPGGPSAVLVSHAFWQQQLAGEEDVLERTLRISSDTYAVVGVLPPGFDFPAGAAFWASAEHMLRTEGRTGHNWSVLARLAPDVTLASAQQEATAIAQRLQAEHGDATWMEDARVVELRDSLVGDARPVIGLLAAAVAFLLLVSGATVANLLLAQSVARSQEFAVRQAIGATGGRLLRQVLAEYLVLVGVGCALGVWLAHVAVQTLLTFDGGRLPMRETIGVDARSVVFGCGLALLVAVALAMATAGRLARQAPSAVLSGGARGGVGGKGVERMRQGLVVGQVAFTLILLVCAGVLGQRLAVLLRADPGFPTSGLLVMSATFARAPLDEGARRSQEVSDIVQRLRAISQVDEAGGINAFPLSGLGANGQFLEMMPGDRIESFEDFMAIGQLPGRAGYAEYRVATPGYFEAMGIDLRAGRLFTWSDTADAPHVAIVSESLAAQQWPDRDPLGRTIQFGNMDGDVRPMTVVGVVRDVRDDRVDSEPAAMLYGHAAQRTQAFSSFAFVVRGPGDPLSVAGQARAAVAAIAPDVPTSTRLVDDIVSATYGSQRFSALVVVLFAVSALLLAVSGVYGVSSFAVSSRTREIGVRMVLGASTRGIVALVLREGLTLVAIGVVVGSVGAYVAARVFSSVLADLGAQTPGMLVMATALIGLCALAACFIPARRAALVEPAVAIRD